MIKGIIYKYTSPSGKIYIGQTTNEAVRRSKFLDKDSIYAGNKMSKERKTYPNLDEWKYEILTTVEDDDFKSLKDKLDYLEAYNIIRNNSMYRGLNHDLGSYDYLGNNKYFKEWFESCSFDGKFIILEHLRQSNKDYHTNKAKLSRIKLTDYWETRLNNRDILLTIERTKKQIEDIEYKISHSKKETTKNSYIKRKDGYIERIEELSKQLVQIS